MADAHDTHGIWEEIGRVVAVAAPFAAAFVAGLRKLIRIGERQEEAERRISALEGKVSSIDESVDEIAASVGKVETLVAEREKLHEERQIATGRSLKRIDESQTATNSKLDRLIEGLLNGKPKGG